MSMLSNFMAWLKGFVKDPYKKETIRTVHDPIIEDLQREANRIRYVRTFPLARTVGHQRLVRGKQKGTINHAKTRTVSTTTLE